MTPESEIIKLLKKVAKEFHSTEYGMFHRSCMVHDLCRPFSEVVYSKILITCGELIKPHSDQKWPEFIETILLHNSE